MHAQVAVREDQALLIPDNWSDAEAAGFVETTLTAYLNIFEFGGLNGVQAGTTKQGAVLLHGGGSGVGTQGIKLSKAKGLKVFVTAGRCILHDPIASLLICMPAA